MVDQRACYILLRSPRLITPERRDQGRLGYAVVGLVSQQLVGGAAEADLGGVDALLLLAAQAHRLLPACGRDVVDGLADRVDQRLDAAQHPPKLERATDALPGHGVDGLDHSHVEGREAVAPPLDDSPGVDHGLASDLDDGHAGALDEAAVVDDGQTALSPRVDTQHPHDGTQRRASWSCSENGVMLFLRYLHTHRAA